MEQNQQSAPIMIDAAPKNGNGLKIATVVASIVALCGIGFGVYGMMKASEKKDTNPVIEVQVKNSDGTITSVESPEIQTVNNKTTVTISPVTTEEGTSFSDNILSSIKSLDEGTTFGFKSLSWGGTSYAYIDTLGNLIYDKSGNKYTVASDVVYADFLWYGNGGSPSLYFVRDDGTVGVVKEIGDVDPANGLNVEDVAVTGKAVSVKNITINGGHRVIVIDSEGNFINI